MTEADKAPARALAKQAHRVGWVRRGERRRRFVQWISFGRLGGQRGWPVVLQLDTPWQDTLSNARIGWRQRAANLAGEFAFSVNYQVCRRCRIAWVEQPYTFPQYQRASLAAAGLAALRDDHPGLTWHTLGGHLTDSRQFWACVTVDVPGGYERRAPCPYIDRGS
jgi:hypothetical protein